MTIFERLDPELQSVVRHVPVMDLKDIPAARTVLMEVFKQIGAAQPNAAVNRADHSAPGTAGQPPASLRVFRPDGVDAVLPCLLWISGGGYVLTAPDVDDQWCDQIADDLQCVVVSVNWRRAPEHPFPAALEDSYAGLSWIFANAPALRVDLERVVVGGASSGGGAAAGVALLARDRKQFRIAHQLLIYPMLDDRQATNSSHMVDDAQLWNRSSNEFAWRAYLGAAHGSAEVSAYAAPARMEDLSGLPPTTILTAELDLFVDEDIAYAQRLMHAGVPTELHVYPAAHHGFDRHMPAAAVSRRLYADRDTALRRAFGTSQST
jgi:acetyl esterase/lipase